MLFFIVYVIRSSVLENTENIPISEIFTTYFYSEAHELKSKMCLVLIPV